MLDARASRLSRDRTWRKSLTRQGSQARIDVVISEPPPKIARSDPRGDQRARQACRWPITCLAGAARITDQRRKLHSN